MDDNESHKPSLIYKAYKVFLCLISVNIFIVSAFTIVLQQFLVKAIFFRSLKLQQKLLDNTKKKFIVLLIVIFKINTPNSKIRITIPKTTNQRFGIVKLNEKKIDLLTAMKHETNFVSNSVVIANHQIYTDWVYLWWLSYTSGLGGNIYILLKKSLESIPILGYGMKNYRFIFLSRKWEQDKINLHNHLNDINLNNQGIGRLSGREPERIMPDGEIVWPAVNLSNEEYRLEEKWPYQLILFPEGTNLSANTKLKSNEFAKKIDKTPLQNILLPHVTGIYEILKNLTTCSTVYDLTIGYSGVKQNEFAQDIYTMKRVFLEGKSPDIVDIHVTAKSRSEIPLSDINSFSDWLFERWRLKDDLMEKYYSQNGSFCSLDMDGDCDTYMFDCTCNHTEYAAILIPPLLSFLFVLKYFVSWFF